MQALDLATCPECSKRLVDAGDELVCPGCGIATEKQVVEHPSGGKQRPRDAVRSRLGSYMGPLFAPPGQRSARGITGGDGRYGYLKAVSDSAWLAEGAAVDGARLTERVGEKLGVPGPVLLEAASMASKVLPAVRNRGRVSVSAISAYSLISASRLEAAPASPSEVLAAFSDLGRKVTSSAVIQLALESPVRTYAKGPNEYLPRVAARRATGRRLTDRLGRDGIRPAWYLSALQGCARELLSMVDRTELSGRRPCALAAAVMYSAECVLSAREGRDRRLTQREVAVCADTSEYTVRDQCNEIFLPSVRKLVARRTQPPTPPPVR